MFKAIVSAETLTSALDSISVLVDECKIHLEEDGLEIRAVDPANVGMVDLSLDAAAFESYEADGGLIGVDLSRLEDIAGMAESAESTRVTHSSPSTTKMASTRLASCSRRWSTATRETATCSRAVSRPGWSSAAT